MAFRRYGKYYKRRGFRRGARRTGLRRKTVAKSVKRYVKRAIHRQVENKEIITYARNTLLPTWESTTYTGWSLNLMPAPTLGTGTNNRVGNQIKIVKGVIRGTINLTPYNATTNPNALPVWVKMFLVRDITSNAAYNTLTLGASTQFFKGNGSALGFQGNVLDTDLPINDDYFRVVASKMFKIGQCASYGISGTTSGYNDNSPFSKKFVFDYSKHVKKMLKFTDATWSTLPMNENLYLVVQAVSADGTTSSGQNLAEIHYCNHIKYEDA